MYCASIDVMTVIMLQVKVPTGEDGEEDSLELEESEVIHTSFLRSH